MSKIPDEAKLEQVIQCMYTLHRLDCTTDFDRLKNKWCDQFRYRCQQVDSIQSVMREAVIFIELDARAPLRIHVNDYSVQHYVFQYEHDKGLRLISFGGPAATHTFSDKLLAIINAMEKGVMG